ncbi:MAG: hypothetical protein CMJ35_13595 [Phycisphaerae bacterium]|nr:hypothetical protein [Phycisphaerae bacterium]
MKTATSTSRGFSMLEMTLVIVIVGIIAATAAPRFADAGTGRRLSAAQRVIEKDIETIQLRARATGKPHIIAFYPSKELYIAFEGTETVSDAVVLIRDLTDEPLGVELSRTNIGDDEDIVISVMGDIENDFQIGILREGIEKAVSFSGSGFSRPAVSRTETAEEIKTAELVADLYGKLIGK